MTPDRISYKKIFVIGSYTTEHIGVEASLDRDDNPEVELAKLKDMVESMHTATVAELDQYRGSHTRTIEQDAPRSLEEDILSCTDIKVLDSYRFIVRGKPVLQAAFDQQHEKLSK